MKNRIIVGLDGSLASGLWPLASGLGGAERVRACALPSRGRSLSPRTTKQLFRWSRSEGHDERRTGANLRVAGGVRSIRRHYDRAHRL